MDLHEEWTLFAQRDDGFLGARMNCALTVHVYVGLHKRLRPRWHFVGHGEEQVPAIDLRREQDLEAREMLVQRLCPEVGFHIHVLILIVTGAVQKVGPVIVLHLTAKCPRWWVWESEDLA